MTQHPDVITDVIAIMERTLNHIDSRLANHGRRVAYIVYQMLWPSGKYTEKEIRDICICALLHDIGAYKTEEIDQMVSFETNHTLDHSIYSYLFFKHFSPLPHMAEVLLYHHTSCTRLNRDNPCAELAHYIFIADRLDILHVAGRETKKKLLEQLEQQRDILFFGDILDEIKQRDLKLPVTDEDVAQFSIIERVLYQVPLTQEEAAAYLKMVVLFIDFRSHQTLTHTIATASISDALAELTGIDAYSRQKLVTGSWLHDIGKTGIPLSILEKPESLSANEMRIIQQHVSLTDQILQGTVLDEVRKIAAHHHEKLNGSGYPDGLKAQELSTCERIAVVADIFSALCGVRSYKQAFPKEKVIAILQSMTGNGLLDASLVEVAVQHYDWIMEHAMQNIRPYEQGFEAIRAEFEHLKADMDAKRF